MKNYIDSFMRYRFLLVELVKKGIKLKYRRSYLGLIWTLLEPLLTMIVLTFVFGSMLGSKGGVYGPELYPVYILCGRLLLFLKCLKDRNEINKIKPGNDKESIRTKISISFIKCNL